VVQNVVTHFFPVHEEHRDQLAKAFLKLRASVNIDHLEWPHGLDVRQQVALHFIAQVTVTACHERIGHWRPEIA
jgi:hypothetical protein